MAFIDILKRTHGAGADVPDSDKTPRATRKKPYVISSDLYGLMQAWSREKGYRLPPRRFFNGLTKDLQKELRRAFGGKVEVVSDKKLKRGMNRLARRSPYPVISLDRAYVDDKTPNVEGYLDLTRLVDRNQNGLGLAGRDGKTTLQEEVAKHASDGAVKPVVLIDDVIFGGDTNLQIADAMRRVNRPVAQMISGITIGEGGDKIRKTGVRIDSVREYADVVDEVCERDFFAGVPLSGKVMRLPGGFVASVPYMEPFAAEGKMRGYASIGPDKVRQFSEFCLDQSARLWEGVEQASGKKVPTADLPKPIIGLVASASVAESLRWAAKEYRRRSSAAKF